MGGIRGEVVKAVRTLIFGGGLGFFLLVGRRFYGLCNGRSI